MNKNVLITGASTGIGYELAKLFAKNGHNLMLVSRDRQILAGVAKEMEDLYGIHAKAIPKDLSRPSAPRELYDEITGDDKFIHVLVNNAGFAINGKFTDLGEDEHNDLIQLNISALTMLCRRFGKDMVNRGSGKILNVASTAAFQAGPFMSTYYASKAYVLSLSEALNNELARDGVHVSVLCPGPTQTQFAVRADMKSAKLLNLPWMMSAESVADIAYSGLMTGKKIIIPGFMNRLLAFGVRLTPRSLLILMIRYLNKQ
jgi:uncharacterized protein